MVLKSVDEWEKEWTKKQSLRKRIKYKFWSIYYYIIVKITNFLRNLATKMDRL